MSDYPWNLDVRPLTTWPGELTHDSARKRSQFSAPIRNTLRVMTRELWHLGAQHPVMEVAIPPEQFRIDGKPRAQARAEHPGVVLSLPTTDVGPLRYATDVFTTWQDNLRAICLGLEALRRVERYGITRRGEQYVGFKALPAGIGLGATHMTTDVALKVIREEAGLDGAPLTGDDELRQAIRVAKARAHPDRNNGDRSRWDAVEQAALILQPASLSTTTTGR